MTRSFATAHDDFLARHENGYGAEPDTFVVCKRCGNPTDEPVKGFCLDCSYECCCSGCGKEFGETIRPHPECPNVCRACGDGKAKGGALT